MVRWYYYYLLGGILLLINLPLIIDHVPASYHTAIQTTFRYSIGHYNFIFLKNYFKAKNPSHSEIVNSYLIPFSSTPWTQ